MPFIPKDWSDSPSTATPITAAELERIEAGVQSATALGEAALSSAAAPELIRDTMGTALVAGANVTITPNDGADTITIAATGGGSVSDATTGAKGIVQLAGDLGGSGTAAATPRVVAASETVAGKVELATAAETTTGTDNTRAVHPAGLKVELDKKANLASPTFTGDPKAPTPATSDNDTSIATTAFVKAAIAAGGGGGGASNGALAPVSASLYWQMIPYAGFAQGQNTSGAEYAIQMPLGPQTFEAVSSWVETAEAGGKIIVGFRKIGADGIPGAVEAQVALPADATGRTTVTGLSLVLTGGLYAVCFASTGAVAYRPGPHPTTDSSTQFGGYGGGLHTVGAMEGIRTRAMQNGNALSGSTLAASWSLTSSVGAAPPPIVAVRRSA